MAGKRAVLIAGPTASGKSTLAVKAARALGGWVINADSMQVYAELAILTARPGSAQHAEIPHRLYGTVSGQQHFSVGAWLALAEAEIASAWDAGAVPVIVGGTGLYFDALTGGLAEIPEIPVPVRNKWRALAQNQPMDALRAQLRARDPQMARRLADADPQRLLRALEVIDATGRSLADWQRDPPRPTVLAEAEIQRVVLAPPRDLIYARTDARVMEMVKMGAVGEVEALLAMKFAGDAPVMKAIGVAELGAHIRGEQTLADARTQMQTRTRNYAKRQFTWIRGRMAGWRHAGTPGEGLAGLEAEIRT